MGISKILSNNNKGVDAKEAESKLRNEYDGLLGADEHIELAFKCQGDGRDKNFFTSHRILTKLGIGFGQKRKRFVSIPYESIKGFSIQTAGKFDRDTELTVWYEGGGPMTMDFVKDAVNLFEVQQFFNNKVFGRVQAVAPLSLPMSNGTPTNRYSATNVESVYSLLGDAVQIDPKSIQDRFGFTSNTPILMPGEQVEVAYRARRDFIVLTPTRYLSIDVKGLSGKKIEFLSMLWKCVKAFSVETAGRFDIDGEFILHTNMKGRIKQDLREGKMDLFQVQMTFANKLLGGGGTPSKLIPGVDLRKGHVDPGAALWTGSKNRPLDATEVERVYRSNPCLLQDDEHVEMAFRGRRDLVIFTTKRIINVDVKGLSGKKVNTPQIPKIVCQGFSWLQRS